MYIIFMLLILCSACGQQPVVGTWIVIARNIPQSTFYGVQNEQPNQDDQQYIEEKSFLGSKTIILFNDRTVDVGNIYTGSYIYQQNEKKGVLRVTNGSIIRILPFRIYKNNMIVSYGNRKYIFVKERSENISILYNIPEELIGGLIGGVLLLIFIYVLKSPILKNIKTSIRRLF